MKKLSLLITICVLSLTAIGQHTGQWPYSLLNNTRGTSFNGIRALHEMFFPISDTNWRPLITGAITIRPQDTLINNGLIYSWSGVKWNAVGGSTDLSDYVTISTSQTITGAKTFESASKMSGIELTNSPPSVTGSGVSIGANGDGQFQIVDGNGNVLDIALNELTTERVRTIANADGTEVLSVNGATANSSGAVAVAIDKFALEDNTATEDRSFDASGFDFGITGANDFSIDGENISYTANTDLKLYGNHVTIGASPALNSFASGQNAVGIGVGAAASGDRSVALIGGIATGYKSFAMQTLARAQDTSSVAIGNGVVANKTYQFATGKFNDTTVYPIFVVGNGASAVARSNAMYVLSTGEGYFGSLIRMGSDTAATKAYARSIGGGSGSGELTVGTTTIASGTTTKVLFNNAGVLGEYTVSGSGDVALTTSPTLVTPTLGVASATALNITGTGGNGFEQIANQSSAPSTPTSAGRIFFDASNRLSWIGTNGFVRTFDGTANSADRIYVLPDLAGTVALTANNLSVFAATTSAQLRGVVSDELGTGAALFDGATPTSFILTNATALPVSSGISGLGTGVAALLAATPTGGTSLVGSSSPTLTGTVVMPAFNTSSTSTSANLSVPSAASIGASTSVSQYLFAGASNISYRVGVRGSTNGTPSASNSAASFVVGTNAMTIAGSGTHALFASAVINPLAITAGAGALTNSATLYLNDATTGATNNYNLWAAGTGVNRFDGDVQINTAGKGLQLKSGTGARAGNATLVGGTVTVTNTTVTANTLVVLTRKTSGGTIGTAITYTLSAGASFTINSDNPLDTSVFTYMLIELN